MNPETKDFLEKLFAQDRTFFQAWTGYLMGVQQRQAELAKDLIDSNAKIAELGQNLGKSAARYGEAVLEWSQQAVAEFSPKDSG